MKEKKCKKIVMKVTDANLTYVKCVHNILLNKMNNINVLIKIVKPIKKKINK